MVSFFGSGKNIKGWVGPNQIYHSRRLSTLNTGNIYTHKKKKCNRKNKNVSDKKHFWYRKQRFCFVFWICVSERTEHSRENGHAEYVQGYIFIQKTKKHNRTKHKLASCFIFVSFSVPDRCKSDEQFDRTREDGNLNCSTKIKNKTKKKRHCIYKHVRFVLQKGFLFEITFLNLYNF